MIIAQRATALFAAFPYESELLTGGIIGAVLLVIALAAVAAHFGAIWLQAYMSGAQVSALSLIGMSFRQVKPRVIVAAKTMGVQAGLSIDPKDGMSTASLEAHFLAGGDVMRVVSAMVAADRAGIELEFDRAAAIDLAGRDVLDAVRTSVSPRVIDCPESHAGDRLTLSAVSQDGVELLVHARVTVRTNLQKLIGGATEATIVARVGEGIITAIGSARTYMDLLGTPDHISKGMLDRGLDANTAFEIVSIDILEIDVGENIGARLQADQAHADTRMAQAAAEARRAAAVARGQEMTAKLAESRAALVLAEAEIPPAMAQAIRAGNIYAPRTGNSHHQRPKEPRSVGAEVAQAKPRSADAGRTETIPFTKP